MALVDAANVLIHAFGQDDVYRIGGDEFIAILPTDDETDIRRRFAAIDEALAAINRETRLYRLPLGMAKGFAIYQPGEDTGCKMVAKRADFMMYDDKIAYYSRTNRPTGDQ